MMKYFSILLFFISSLLFSQENINFDDFDTDDYEYGIMYIEIKTYENNIILVNKYKKSLNDMPIIKKQLKENNTIYTFTGYIIDKKNNVSIINVKLKLLYSEINIEKELLSEFNIANNEIKNLIENMNESGEYTVKGKDINGSFTMVKRLYVNDADEINDNFGMMYAYIIFSNFSNIDQEKISRKLMYYIMEFTY